MLHTLLGSVLCQLHCRFLVGYSFCVHHFFSQCLPFSIESGALSLAQKIHDVLLPSLRQKGSLPSHFCSHAKGALVISTHYSAFFIHETPVKRRSVTMTTFLPPLVATGRKVLLLTMYSAHSRFLVIFWCFFAPPPGEAQCSVLDVLMFVIDPRHL